MTKTERAVFLAAMKWAKSHSSVINCPCDECKTHRHLYRVCTAAARKEEKRGK